jgi:hypothetical protein
MVQRKQEIRPGVLAFIKNSKCPKNNNLLVTVIRKSMNDNDTNDEGISCSDSKGTWLVQTEGRAIVTIGPYGIPFYLQQWFFSENRLIPLDAEGTKGTRQVV